MIPLLILPTLALATETVAMPPAAAAALSRAVSRYRGGVAHAASFTQTYTPAGFANAKRESGTVWIQAPQRLRFDYTTPDKKTFTYDAGEGRFLSPQDKQLTRHTLTPEERARLPIVFLTDPTELSREYAISLEPGAEGADRLLLVPRTPRPELSWLRLTIAPDGAVRDLSYEDASGNRTEFRFEAWRAERARPAEDFRITGPAGTRVVED